MEMESQTEVLGISILQATLLEDINTLEEGRRDLGRRNRSDRSHQRIFSLRAADRLVLALFMLNLLLM